MGDEDTGPSWLSKENDHLHKSKTGEEEPLLFGTGNIPLDGELKDAPPSPFVDVESQSNYGSTADDKASLATGGSSSKKWMNKKQSKKKKKNRPTPPQSIFDERNNDSEIDDPSSVSGDDSKSALSGDTTKPHMPRRNWCLEFFRCVGGVTVISSLGLLATQLIPLILAGFKSQGYFDLALKGKSSF